MALGQTGIDALAITTLVLAPFISLGFAWSARGLAPADRIERRWVFAAFSFSFCSIGILLGGALLLPNSGPRPREKANQVKCGSNLRQIGQAILMYANDHKGQFPATFDLLITDQEMSTEVFICPSTNDVSTKGATTQQIVAGFAKPGRCSYIYIGGNLNTTSATAARIAAYEPLTNHRGTGMNVLFGDGHVEWLDVKAANYMLAELAAGRNPPKPAPPQ